MTQQIGFKLALVKRLFKRQKIKYVWVFERLLNQV